MDIRYVDGLRRRIRALHGDLTTYRYQAEREGLADTLGEFDAALAELRAVEDAVTDALDAALRIQQEAGGDAT